MIVGIGSIGNVGLLNADASANQQINVIVPITNKIDGHFLVYTLAAKKDDMLRLSNVTILRIINQNKTKEIWLELPPLPEQRAIAAFLNAETARIDSLIADYESLIDLLREERQAIVAHAVTKGLNPDAPMKDSGVEWLGMVPEHWGCQKLRRVAKHVDTGSIPSGTISSDEEPDGIPWYTPGDLPDDIILSKSSKVLGQSDSDDNEAKLFPAGCVMVVSIGATLGKVGYTVMDSSANQQINIVWPDTSVIFGRFLAYSLSVKKENMLYMANSSTIGIMNQEKTKEIWLAIPPLPEQHAIAEYLDAETARIDGLIADAERAIELLRESRAALITDAVTGKMDVRDWQKECA